MSDRCKAITANGTRCTRRAGAYTINGTCRQHHTLVRAWSARHGYPHNTATPWGIVDTWGSPTADGRA